MPETAKDTTNLKSQYASQVTSDLEHNEREQQRIGEEVTALQEQLRGLEEDHALLVEMRQALGGEQTAAAPRAKASGSAASRKGAKLPKARKSKDDAQPAKPRGTARTAKAKETASTAGAAGKKKPGAAKSRATSARSAGQPTLRELVAGHLSGLSEPRSAAEITTALTQAHPERKFGTTVVRNTLEALVAKGQADRSKQNKSVFYSATTPVADAPKQEDTPAAI
ncbi:hypothetical protein ACWGJ2_03060 [Streptomyces sp. NPDC054796]